ncbi:DUF1062 domain-containing protein [Kineococcus sp. NPDC059986]|uniref:DUF1062 domain-containing protein n=1 Tax=Kineococcus sp. NPDC059986 TaxID=3155538 RepID=UPI00344DB3DE
MPTLTWAVTPTRLPLVVRRCHRCGAERFRAGGRFRVNANGKLLDAWLLAHCTGCGDTADLTVFERTHVRTVDAELLDGLHGNDPDLVSALLLDPATAHRNRYALDWDGAWVLDAGTAPPPRALPGEDLEVTVEFLARIPARPVRLLATGLGLPRAAVERLVVDGRIVAAVDLRARRSSGFEVLLEP